MLKMLGSRGLMGLALVGAVSGCDTNITGAEFGQALEEWICGPGGCSVSVGVHGWVYDGANGAVEGVVVELRAESSGEGPPQDSDTTDEFGRYQVSATLDECVAWLVFIHPDGRRRRKEHDDCHIFGDLPVSLDFKSFFLAVSGQVTDGSGAAMEAVVELRRDSTVTGPPVAADTIVAGEPYLLHASRPKPCEGEWWIRYIHRDGREAWKRWTTIFRCSYTYTANYHFADR